jgi:fumarate hydratase subunit beta
VKLYIKHNIELPVSPDKLKKLKLADIIFLNGTIITARDQAHKRIIKLNKKNSLPSVFEPLENSAIYHCGPIIQKKGDTYQILSGGPTTSQRMDSLENEVIDILKVKFIIGKGGMRNLNTKDYRVVYLSYTGGCGAIINKKINKIEKILWEDLGKCEAIYFLDVVNFGPLIVTQINGRTLYQDLT